MSFHTFTLQEDRCVRLLVKKLDRGMPESVVREELESLSIRSQRDTQLRSDGRDQDPTKQRPPITHSTVLMARRPEVLKVRAVMNSSACECRWSCTWPQKVHCNAIATSASDARSVTTDTLPGASPVGAPVSPAVALPRGNSLSPVAAGDTTRRNTGAI